MYQEEWNGGIIMPEFVCTQCCGDEGENGEHCKVHVDYDGYAERPTGCLYESMRKEGYTGKWEPYIRKKKTCKVEL